MESLEDYIKQRVKDGYINEDGRPLKCDCGHTEFYSNTIDIIAASICEYEVICKNQECKKLVGYWSYGHWQH